MTISTTIIVNSYSGNGSTTAFTYNFKITDEDDIDVIIRSSNGTETVKTKTTHYTVSGVGSNSGTVTFTSGNIPASGETVVLRRSTPQTQEMDLIDNDPMSADTIETAHDKAIAISQELQEEVNRSIKLSRTNTMTSTEFTVDATNRANKVLAFDSSGEISVTQELGTYKGTDTTVTTAAYVQRDIIKSTTTAQLNNVYICVADSVVGDSLTDTDHFELLVDAVSAATSQTAAASSATAAAASAASALSHKNDAETAKTASETAKTAAETAKTASETAQTAAETAKTNAETSETNSAASASAASASQTAAAASATAASSSQTSAASSATTATTKATEASTSAASALSHKNDAETAKTASETAKTAAETAQTAAETAQTSAQSSSTSAASSATSASSSATAAANSAAAAANSFDDFDDKYLGSKTSNPTVDNDGNALVSGALYFNSTANEMRVYDGANWIAASSAGSASLILYEYTATAGQTTFSGTDNNSATLSYSVDNLQVVLNGIVLDPSDYTATSGTSIVLASGAALNDILNVYAFKSFTVAELNANNLNDGTVPDARFPATLPAVSGANLTNLDASDLASGTIPDARFPATLPTVNGSNLTNITPADDTVTKAKLADQIDIFSVTSLSAADLGNGLHIKTGDTGATSVSGNADELIVENTGNVGITLQSANDGTGNLYFGDVANGSVGRVSYDHSNNDMIFNTNASERMRIDSSGNVGIGTTSPSQKLDVNGTVKATAFQGDGSALTNLPGGGKIGQVLNTTDTTERRTNSTSYTAVTGTSLSITPSATSSKVLILVTGLMRVSGGNGMYTIYRGSTNVDGRTGTYDGLLRIDATGGNGGSLSFLDSPSTTSATTYQVYFKIDGSGNYVYLNEHGSSRTSVTLMEVLA